MATRLLSFHQKLLAYHRENFRSWSIFLRFFSSQNRGSSESSEQPSNPTKVNAEPISKWLNIRAGIFGPDDDRLPLPGDVGMEHDISIYKNCSLDENSFIKTNHMMVDNTTPILTKQEQRFEEIRQAQENCKKLNFKVIADNGSDEMFLECRIQECPDLLKKDFQAFFPNINLMKHRMTVMTLCQQTVHDMSGWSEEVEVEREELVGQFVNAAHKICDTLRREGYWADFIDPSSGRPYLGSFTNATLFETDERYRHFGFRIEDLGCCKVISHRVWGTRIFVGALFSNAPVHSEVIEDALNHFKIKIET